MSHIHYENVVIVGLGRSGSAAAKYCLAHLSSNPDRPDDGFTVGNITVYGGKSNPGAEAVAKTIRQAGCEVIFDSEDVKGSYDLAVVSPGISENSDFYKAAKSASKEIISEPELAYRVSPQRWIGITGTNGKTTTTTLTEHLLNTAGITAKACGNIGLPCISTVEDRTDGDYLVAELSSFQLASTSRFRPKVAVLLNITPDHVEWHGSLKAYAAAKAKIFANQGPDDFAIVDCTAKPTLEVAQRLVSSDRSVICIGGPEGMETGYHPSDFIGMSNAPILKHKGYAFIFHGQLVVEIDGFEHDLAMVDDMQIKGSHNMQNALAAAAAAIVAGASDEDVTKGLLSFAPLEHRVEPCGELDGVSFYNDSKATNTDSAAKALTAFVGKPVIILLGGHDKGTDLTDLVDDVLGQCKAAVCFGESRNRFVGAFEDGAKRYEEAKGEQTACKLIQAEHLQQALDAAVDFSESGDIVLLSPACSSFDEFKSFEQRGEVFKQMVADIIAAAK